MNHDTPDDRGRHPATAHTCDSHAGFARSLPPDTPGDRERATRGFIARRADPTIANLGPSAGWSPVSWDFRNWDFVQGDAPETVNPSLWRQAKLNGEHGLFEVVPGFYQVRAFDTSVVTFVAGATGWVVVDPLTTAETAAAAFELVTEHLGARPINAVIYTHAHVDHYGGILGLIGKDELARRDVPIVAPDGFLEAAVAENVAAGAAMGRRAMYQYGMLLPWDERGHVDQGLSKGPPVGSVAMVPPTVTITRTGETLVLDGVTIEFQLTPDTEAPAEMHFYFPEQRVLCLAENCTATMHNVITLRGAIVRDALMWSRYIDDAMDRWGDQVDVSIASHSWPRWGRDDVLEHMTNQRDLYRWLHDEAMRYANLGCTPDEIAASVELPPGLWADWSCHGYYGTVSHNVRGVYQRYLGWYDGHPASLARHTPTEAGRRYVEFMGGIDEVVVKAQQSFDAGDYRWVTEVLRHAVAAEPTHRGARLLQAAAFEQLGYQAESGPWRDSFLMAAQELRNGAPATDIAFRPNIEAAGGMNLQQVFDYFAIRMDGTRAIELGSAAFDWVVEDTGEVVRLTLSNGTLHGVPGRTARRPRARVESTRHALDRMVARGETLPDLMSEGVLRIDGDAAFIATLWGLMVDFPLFFPVIEPGPHAR